MTLSSGSNKIPVRIKQSLCWWCFVRSTTPENLIKEAAALGFGGIEIAPQEYWEAIIANNLKIISIGGHGTFTDGLNRRENLLFGRKLVSSGVLLCLSSLGVR